MRMRETSSGRIKEKTRSSEKESSGEDEAVGDETKRRYKDEGRLVYRLSSEEQVPPLVLEVFVEAGWNRYNENNQHPDDWNLWWRTGKFRYPEPHQLHPWQRLNHHPKSSIISKKDQLCRSLRVCKEVYGKGIFNFCPPTFNLPSEYSRFLNEFNERELARPGEEQYWIVKPADMSRGRGIYLLTRADQLHYTSAVIIQEYVHRPLLIAGYKFDLRIYAAITSFHPLTLYLHNQGLVRFSTDRYDLTSLDNPYSHLTNTSINKLNPDFSAQVRGGTKWTLAQLTHYLTHVAGCDDRWLWSRVTAATMLVFISQIHSLPRGRRCFDLFGIDILIDEKLKPWLLEVNYGPQLVCDTVCDVQVKKAVISDLLKLCHFTRRDVLRGDLSSSYSSRRANNHRHGNQPSSAYTQRTPSTSAAQPEAGTQEYGRWYKEQRDLARKKKHMDEWQNIENVLPNQSDTSTSYLIPTVGVRLGARAVDDKVGHAKETGKDKVETGRDKVETGKDKVETGKDKVETGKDKVETGKDKVETGKDNIESLEDKVEPASSKKEIRKDKMKGDREVGSLPPPPIDAVGEKGRVGAEGMDEDGSRYESHPCFNLPTLSRLPTATVREGSGWVSGSGHTLPPVSPTLVGEMDEVGGREGGFTCIFPFNEHTKLKHSSSAEIRRSVKEIKWWLQEAKKSLTSGEGDGDLFIWQPLPLNEVKAHGVRPNTKKN